MIVKKIYEYKISGTDKKVRQVPQNFLKYIVSYNKPNGMIFTHENFAIKNETYVSYDVQNKQTKSTVFEYTMQYCFEYDEKNVPGWSISELFMDLENEIEKMGGRFIKTYIDESDKNLSIYEGGD